MLDSNIFDNFNSQQKSNNDFFAKIAGVYNDGVSLEINGEITSKHYMVNTGCTYKVGDIVKVLRISGTYIVEYKIGRKSSSIN